MGFPSFLKFFLHRSLPGGDLPAPHTLLHTLLLPILSPSLCVRDVLQCSNFKASISRPFPIPLVREGLDCWFPAPIERADPFMRV